MANSAQIFNIGRQGSNLDFDQISGDLVKGRLSYKITNKKVKIFDDLSPEQFAEISRAMREIIASSEGYEKAVEKRLQEINKKLNIQNKTASVEKIITGNDAATAPIVKELVENDKDLAHSAKLNATPTFYLKGEKIAHPQSADALSQAIQQALE